MVLPKLNLSFNTRNIIRTIYSTLENAHQAKHILTHGIKTSMKRVRTIEKLTFIKTCIKEELVTKRVNFMVSRLCLTKGQEKKVKQTMMKNIRSDIHKELSAINKECKLAYRKVKDIVQPDNLVIYHKVKEEEICYAKNNSRNHFASKLTWIRSLNMKLENEARCVSK